MSFRKKRKKKKKISKENKSLFLEVLILFLVVFSLACVLAVLFSTKSYTVFFDSNGGNQIPHQIIRGKNVLRVPDDPKKEGYQFLGWYKGDTLYDFKEEVKETFTLEAHWKKIEVLVEGISLDKTTLTLEPNETYSLKVTIYPEEALEKQVAWESNEPSIVSVDEFGVLTALKDGKATIKAITRDGAFEASVEVTVKTPVPGITLEENSISLEVGHTYKINPIVYPKDYLGHLLYTTNSNLLSIDQNGVVKALLKGEASIIIKTDDGKYQAILRIIIPEKTLTNLSILGMDKIPVGSTANLKIVTEPAGISTNILWKSSNPDILTVDNTGRIVGISPGVVTVLASTLDGKKVAQHEITVFEN